MRYETSGMLSYHAISCSQDMHAEPGEMSERFSGTRAATTFRKEPRARPGASAMTASPMEVLSAAGAVSLRASHRVIVSGPTVAPVFGGSGAPTGMFLITGKGLSEALFVARLIVPRLIGPSTVAEFPLSRAPELGCVQSEPWKIWLFAPSVTALELFETSETSVSIELLPLEPCHAEAFVLHGDSAQTFVLLLTSVAVPATSNTPVPV